jgi:hypothetical protein
MAYRDFEVVYSIEIGVNDLHELRQWQRFATLQRKCPIV